MLYYAFLNLLLRTNYSISDGAQRALNLLATPFFILQVVDGASALCLLSC